MEPWDVDQQPPRFLHIYEDGSRDGRDGTRQTVRTQDGLATLLIEIVHLITARGITHELPPRPLRRDFERASGKKWPDNAWVIRIGSSVNRTRTATRLADT